MSHAQTLGLVCHRNHLLHLYDACGSSNPHPVITLVSPLEYKEKKNGKDICLLAFNIWSLQASLVLSETLEDTLICIPSSVPGNYLAHKVTHSKNELIHLACGIARSE